MAWTEDTYRRAGWTRITLRLRAEDAEALEALAELRRESRAALLSRLLREEVAREVLRG